MSALTMTKNMRNSHRATFPEGGVAGREKSVNGSLPPSCTRWVRFWKELAALVRVHTLFPASPPAGAASTYCSAYRSTPTEYRNQAASGVSIGMCVAI